MKLWKFLVLYKIIISNIVNAVFLSIDAQENLINCLKLKENFGNNSFDCMQIIKKEMENQNSKNTAEKETKKIGRMKQDFNHLENLVDIQLKNLNELKSKLDLFKGKYFGNNDNENSDDESEPKDELSLSDLEKKLEFLKGNNPN